MEPRVLTYEATGEGDPLVLVPGGLTGWVSWIPHAEVLSQTRRVIRVQPIHNELGSAGRPADPGYTVATERESLRMTLDALGIARADFAGWSGGGRALLEFALTYPERVRSLALVEPAASWMLHQIGNGAAPDADRIDDLLRPLAGRAVSEEDLAAFAEIAGFAPSRNAARANPGWERWLPHRTALSWQWELGKSSRSVEELHAIGCPVLLVKGTMTTTWLRRVVDGLAARLPHATVLELDGDHACHIQSIDPFLKAFSLHLDG